MIHCFPSLLQVRGGFVTASQVLKISRPVIAASNSAYWLVQSDDVVSIPVVTGNEY